MARGGRRCILARLRHYEVIVEPDEDGIYVATISSVPGGAEQGETVEGALENLKEILLFHLESLDEAGEEVPPSDESVPPSDESAREVRSLELTV